MEPGEIVFNVLLNSIGISTVVTFDFCLRHFFVCIKNGGKNANEI